MSGTGSLRIGAAFLVSRINPGIISIEKVKMCVSIIGLSGLTLKKLSVKIKWK